MGTPSTPLVSIITVCLDAAAHIAAAMESVLGQSWANIEYLVIDGGSTDGTVDVIRDFEPRFGGRMRWISEHDEGTYDAMNKGLALATGDLIGILNADDRYELDAVQLAVEAWDGTQQAVLYGHMRLGGASDLIKRAPGKVDAQLLRRDMLLNHPATFVTAGAYRQLGGYDTRYPIAADYDLLLRLAESDVSFVHVDAVLADFSLTGTSQTRIRDADRDATRVRIAHGVSPVLAWARFGKRAVTSSIYSRLKRFAWVRRAYGRYSRQ